MKLEERKPSGREKDQAAIDRLAELREKLHSEEVSTARKAAFSLSWMQEDGLDIFIEALFGSFPRTTKQAAAYGLRSMNGRMKKMAEEVLTKGLTHDNRITKETCAKSLLLMKQPAIAKKKGGFRGRPGSGGGGRSRGPRIREFRGRGQSRNDYSSRNGPSRNGPPRGGPRSGNR